ncbi:MAG: transposase family protein [Gemmataceae bacterium]|nr:transposase family protein [Gemmataceae bacterium]
MDDRFDIRSREMPEEAEVSASLAPSLLGRLRAFVRPFAATLAVPEQRQHVGEYVSGLLSPLERKTGESIAYLHDQERQGIQKFIGYVPWDHRPLIGVLAEPVGRSLGEADGVVVSDPSALAKKGTTSVGVGGQWSGRPGKVDNGQVGVYMGYVSRGARPGRRPPVPAEGAGAGSEAGQGGRGAERGAVSDPA